MNANLTDYKEDSRGRLVPLAAIKPIDLARDELVRNLVHGGKQIGELLSHFRTQAHADIQAFAELSAETYQAPIGGKKGNITLLTFDGRYKLQRQISDQLVFDERLQAAKSLVDECITEWSKDLGTEVKTLLLDAFQVDQQGKINTARVLSLRRMNFEHPKWVQAMQAIADSLLVATSKSYIRLYERDGKGEYVAINLDLSRA